MVPNVIKAFSLRPEKLRTFIAKYNELMLSDDSPLTRLEREMIAVVVSSHKPLRLLHHVALSGCARVFR